MLEYQGVFKWDGFGGKFNLASGDCNLTLINLRKGGGKGLMFMKTHIAVVSDIPAEECALSHVHEKRTRNYTKMTVRSCANHVATSIVKQFGIEPSRLLYVEHTPESCYGPNNEFTVPEKLEEVNFDWHGDKALTPARYSELKDPMLQVVTELLGKERLEAG